MPAYNFQKRFAPLVETGVKRQTIRRRRKRLTRMGDTLYLYEGMRTKKCRRLRDPEICRLVLPVAISEFAIGLGGALLRTYKAKDVFARLDGFGNWPEMRDWFRKQYGLPFYGGEAIYW
jgi:hypothetical protein